MPLVSMRQLLDHAAEQGYAPAQYNLGWLDAKGQGVPHDVGQALQWFSQAADQGEPGAQHNLGMMYETGKGVPQDADAATMWYRRAAEQGRGRRHHSSGNGTSSNPGPAAVRDTGPPAALPALTMPARGCDPPGQAIAPSAQRANAMSGSGTS